MDDRQRRLREWVQGLTSVPIDTWESLNGDASFRRYFRVYFEKAVFDESDARHLIAVDSPPLHENQAAFLEVRQLLAAHHLPVPLLFSADSQHGFMLLSDFGNRLFHAAVYREGGCPKNPSPVLMETLNIWYGKALFLLMSMQAIHDSSLTLLPRYDKAPLLKEMQLFDDWFIKTYLQVDLSNEEKKSLNVIKDLLVASAQTQPQVFVHRDFHSRNLMIRSDESLGLIDFQDAVIGPITYDAVSFLKDAYIEWPRYQQLMWLQQLYAQLSLDEISFSVFIYWFDLMGLQRHLKVLGIFARLKIRDNKHGYESYLPRVMRYVLEVVSIYPELASLNDLINQKLLPSWQRLYGVNI